MIMRWDVQGPYEVAFSTRTGGVSDGPYASLNLGRMTGDDVERVDENRRRLCAAVGTDADRLALNRQVQSTLVHRARAGVRGEPGDGRIIAGAFRETSTEVRFAVFFFPRSGAHNCQGNPPSHHRVQLDRPLGARKLVDVGVFPSATRNASRGGAPR